MLSKKDKEFIREVIREEIREALTVKVRMERKRDAKSGQPLAVPEVEVKDVYLPAHWVEFLPYHEAALRGVQETTDRAKNNSAKSAEAVGRMADIMISYENTIKALPLAVGRLRAITEGIPITPMVELIEENRIEDSI